MSQINDIKEMVQKGYRVSEIAEAVKADEKTVRKYIQQADFSPKVPKVSVMPSQLDPYKERIGQYLAEDKETWYKQCHTAQRMHERLQEEYPAYQLSYNTIQRYVKKLRQQQREQRANQELIWHPGEAQVDFGEAEFIERGQKVRKKYLTVSFPYSNQGFSQVFGGETAECVCQGLKDILAHIGGVPGILVFDNATGVGRRIGDVIHETDLFARFRAHYNLSVRYCNPNAGHEKGNVENKVGYIRRNLFVPLPEISDIEVYNRELLNRQEKKAQENHYRKLIPIRELFEDDRQALQRLPSFPFDACRYLCLKADGYGKVRVDDRHYYSTCPENAGREVWVAVRAHTIDILDDRREVVVRHARQFGDQRSDTCDYRTSLAVLMKNAGAWKNSGVRELVPSALRETMDNQPRCELQDTLRTLHWLTRAYDFETAVAALEEGLRINRTNFCDAAVLAARISGYGLNVAPAMGPDLSRYDQLLKGGDLPC